MTKVIYCWCGRLVKDNKCPKCGDNWRTWENRPKRTKIGKYSGYSKNEEYGKNW